MKTFLLTLAVALLAACETTSSTAPSDSESPTTSRATRESGGGLWNMLEEERRRTAERRAREGRRRKNLAAESARGREAFSPDAQRKMETWWKEFLRNDPKWLVDRFQWRALGHDAREVLVENLLMVLVRAYEQNNGAFYERARSELFELSETSIPYLVGALEVQAGDSVLRKHCVELLAFIGKPALRPIMKAWERTDDRGAREDLLAAVQGMGSRGAPESVPFLVDAVEDSDDIRIKLRAIEGLGRSRDPRAVEPLLDYLEDDDISFRKFAAASLGGFKGRRVIEGLINALERSEKRAGLSDREAEVALNCRRALKASTGRSFKTASEWRRWWKRR